MDVAGTKDPRENDHEKNFNYRRICGGHRRIRANRAGSGARWKRVNADEYQLGEFKLIRPCQLIERCEEASPLKKLGQV